MKKIKLVSRWRWFSGVLVLCVLGYGVYRWSTQVDVATIRNNNNNRIQVIGHGGVGMPSVFNPFQPLPSNSPGSIRAALDAGASGVELDLQLSADSVLVLYHDEFLDNSTGLKGCVATRLWSEMRNQPYTLGFPYDLFQEETLVSLETILLELKKRKEFPILHLDLHHFNFCDPPNGYSRRNAFIAELERVFIRTRVPLEKVYVVSQDQNALMLVSKMKNPPLLVWEEVINMQYGIKMAKKFNTPYLAVKYKILTPEGIRKAHREGLFVITFGGKSRWGLFRMAGMHPDAIEADNVPELLRLLH